MAVSSQIDLERIVFDCFITELNSLKPGNVSRFSDGHGMKYEDFIISAEISSPILCNRQLSTGEKILESVKATNREVGCNTNLGMLLLFAPLIKTCEISDYGTTSQADLLAVLAALHNNDTDAIYQAIRLANPGGLGEAQKHDVRECPDVDLLTAMKTVENEDFIARQYVSGFSEIYTVGLGIISDYFDRWNSVEWATVACYLTYMARFPDSHIRRKYGDGRAQEIRRKTAPVLAEFINNNNPADSTDILLGYDKELKNSGINPGTSADLAASSLFLYQLNTWAEDMNI